MLGLHSAMTPMAVPGHNPNQGYYHPQHHQQHPYRHEDVRRGPAPMDGLAPPRDSRPTQPPSNMPYQQNHYPPRSRPQQFPSRPHPGPGGYGPPQGPSPYDYPPPSPSMPYEPRSSPKTARRPPVLAQPPPVSMSSYRLDSMSSGTYPQMPISPTSPRYGPNGAGPRSRPTTPATHDVGSILSESHSEPPSRPLTAKSSFPDLRNQDPNAASIENFSRPRKSSLRQPVSDMPNRSRPPLLPAPSEDGPEMSDYGSYPWQRPRRPSLVSNVSASTWTPGMSPTHGEFPDHRGPNPRMRNMTSLPNSATRPHFSYSNRTDSSVSGPSMIGTAPWANGDELRSSFRSQLTASSAPGTANTERSSVLTKESSATSLDAHADGETDGDEPSLEDVMGMYEQGFDDDEDDRRNDWPEREDEDFPRRHDRIPSLANHEQRFPANTSEDFPRRMESIPLPASHNQQSPAMGSEDLPRRNGSMPSPVISDQQSLTNTTEDFPRRIESIPSLAVHDQPSLADISEDFPRRNESVPSLASTDQQPLTETAEDHDVPNKLRGPSKLDAEIRQSKLIFTSPAFMATVSHLSMAMTPDEFNDGEKRDSGKSLDSDPSEMSQPTVTNGVDIGSSPPASTINTRQNTPSPVPPSSSHSRAADELDFESVRDPSYPESCPPPNVPGPIEPEDPASRDRYGFKKETQQISRKQYDKWNKGYSEYLARRKKKWQAYLKENSLMTENPNRFPSPSVKTKKFVRKGIPPEWRGAAWFYYAGGPAILAKHSGLYGKLLDKHAKRVDVEAIERDLHRTFPDNVKFKPPSVSADLDNDDPQRPSKETPIIASLRRVLFAFSIYNPHIGYCQSLNFIAGLLLLFVETEEQCFWLLNVITHIYLPGTHDISLEGSKVDLGVLMAEIRDTMPAVWDKIGGELEGNPGGRPSVAKSLRRQKSRFRRKEPEELPTERLPPITLCMTAWFMSCFIGTLPIESTLRVWDVFFYEGSKTLFRTALAIFKAGESEILAVTDPMEMFGVVQSMPRKMLDANGLLESCFKRRNGFNHLSQGAIDERRQERRDQVQSDRASKSKSTLSGNVTESETDVRRKNTLFKRNKTTS